MQRIIIAAIALGLVGLGVQRFLRSLASPQESIGWQLEEMVEGFNATRMRPVIGGFAKSYVDEGTGVDRQDMMRILAGLFFTEIDPDTKAFRLHATLPVEDFVVTLDETNATLASASFRLVFTDTFKGATTLYWDASVTVQLLQDVDGWAITSSERVNHGARSRLH
jgi:hypothetical protein